MEGVRRAAAMRRRIDERVDDLQLLDDRAGPTVRDDERQRIVMLRAGVDEVDVQSVDLGDEVRIGIQLRLDLTPVVFVRPIAEDLLNGCERHALRIVGDGLALRQAGCRQAVAEIDESFLRNVDAEGPDGVTFGCGGGTNAGLG